MKIHIENTVCQWNSETADILVKFCNLILLSEDTQELKTALKCNPNRVLFEKNFLYGFGAHHFWASQRKPFTGEPMDNRLLIVEL